jgi:hypothetical protein
VTRRKDESVSDETIRATAVELAQPATINGWDPHNTIEAAETLAAFLAECGGDREDFDRRVRALRQQLSGASQAAAADFEYRARQARRLYQYVRGSE